MFYLLSPQCNSNIIIIFSPIPLQIPTQTELRDEVPFRGEDCHNSPFQVIFQNFDNLLFISYYSLITIHPFTIHHFWSQFDILRSVQKFYYSQNTIHFRRENTIHTHHSFHRKSNLRVFKFA